MGLDMYLYLQKHEYRFCCDKSEEEKERIKEDFYPEEMEELSKTIPDDCLSKTCKYNVAYWRKANAIHKWFIEGPGEGIDECQMIYVASEQLETLVMTCSQVLMDHSKADKLLPTEDGFFFGSTEYDEWYFQDLEDTVKMLDPVLKFIKKHPEYEIYYRASW